MKLRIKNYERRGAVTQLIKYLTQEDENEVEDFVGEIGNDIHDDVSSWSEDKDKHDDLDYLGISFHSMSCTR
ncbi:MAG: hypothetical protein WCJ81_01145 [bacterium]